MMREGRQTKMIIVNLSFRTLRNEHKDEEQTKLWGGDLARSHLCFDISLTNYLQNKKGRGGGSGFKYRILRSL